ncbi:MAG: hypothetical protein PHO01_03035 [Desulfotomaculaceae bacterium]|nr:hypothetical protein [Desulfotomaculaceae bacterium]
MALSYDNMTRHCFNTGLPFDIQRKNIICNLADNLHKAGYTEEEALGVFFWKLSGLDPPVNYDELLYFQALFRIHRSFCNMAIDNKETALEILGISKDKLELPQKELNKEAKKVYWQQINDLSRDLVSLLANSSEIGIKRKAFIYLIPF